MGVGGEGMLFVEGPHKGPEHYPIPLDHPCQTVNPVRGEREREGEGEREGRGGGRDREREEGMV